jgi:hypothetical protein
MEAGLRCVDDGVGGGVCAHEIILGGVHKKARRVACAQL